MSDSAPTTRIDQDNDRLRVLRMVENQQITPDEAARLLETMDRADRQRSTAEPIFSGPRKVHLRISNLRNGRVHVDMTLPLPLIELLTTVIERFAPGSTARVRPMISMAKGGFVGPLLDFSSGNDRIELTIE